MLCGIGFVVFVLQFLLLRSVKVIPEYERGVVFTLGKFSSIRKPVLTLLIPIIQVIRRVDMHLVTKEMQDDISTISNKFLETIS